MSAFEITMLVCFGCSWPVSIRKSWRARSTGAKSPVFLTLIVVGYVSGVIHKALYSPDFVIALYALNAVMVTIDLCIYFRNRRLERAAAR